MQLSSHLFWDVNQQAIDYNKHARFVIERVVLFGKLVDWKELKAFYGLNKIKQEALQIKTLDLKSLNFLSLVLNEPRENFRCYEQIQSVNKHWNY
jgi:hypothetical protein